MKQDVQASLAYFSTPHPASFEYLPGEGRVLLSAPHAVLQTRNGQIKQAERYTGMLCQLLNSRYGLPCIYKSCHMHDDANHDPRSPYRDALCQYIKEENFRFVLDLHQLSPMRPMALCIGTGHGVNLGHTPDAPDVVRRCFEKRHLTPVTLDDPFAAAMPHTVSATAARAGAAALQLEINTALVMETSPSQRFEDVLEALAETARLLNEQRK